VKVIESEFLFSYGMLPFLLFNFRVFLGELLWGSNGWNPRTKGRSVAADSELACIILYYIILITCFRMLFMMIFSEFLVCFCSMCNYLGEFFYVFMENYL